jgi:hypothetical protein
MSRFKDENMRVSIRVPTLQRLRMKEDDVDPATAGTEVQVDAFESKENGGALGLRHRSRQRSTSSLHWCG